MKISRQIFILLALFGVFITSVHAQATSSLSEERLKGTATDEITSETESEINQHRTDLESAILPDTSTQISVFLNQQVQHFAAKGFRSDYEIGNINPHLSNRSCDNPIQLSFNKEPTEQNNLTLLVECNTLSPWKFYLSLKFNIYGQAIIAANNIVRNQTITAADLTFKEVIANQYSSTHYQDKNDIIGMIARRSIRANSSIHPNYLQPPKLIKRGDDVVIVASSNVISVRMNGTALADGLLGQQIPVKNLKSKRVIKARVQQPGLVSITL